MDEEVNRAANSVYLRALEASDLERIHRWHNDQDLYAWLGSPFRFVSQEAERAWLVERTAYSSSEVNLAICLPDGDRHVGNIYLRGIDWVARSTELSMFIADSGLRGQGIGREALRLCVDHAFHDLGLRRIYLYVLADNSPAITLYHATGFVEEGRLRQHWYKGGRLRDVLVFGLCMPEMQDVREPAEGTGKSPRGGAK